MECLLKESVRVKNVLDDHGSMDIAAVVLSAVRPGNPLSRSLRRPRIHNFPLAAAIGFATALLYLVASAPLHAQSTPAPNSREAQEAEQRAAWQAAAAVATHGPADVTLAIYDRPGPPRGFSHNGDLPFYPCSVIKTFWMAAALQCLETGRIAPHA